MVAGHTRCLVDGHFGLLKRKYQRSNVNSIPELVEVLESSAATNTSHTVDGSNMWREWDSFFTQFFRPVPHIQRQQHFRFDHTSPGKVIVREGLDSQPTTVSLSKRSVTLADVQNAEIPQFLLPGGLSVERQKYLFKEIRPHVSVDCQDQLCPSPAEEECPLQLAIDTG